MTKQVLILCTGNSCRSQMAQVIWQHLAAGKWHAYSAGSSPTGQVHPLAIKALQELELPVDDLESKSVEKFLDQKIDLAVTVCDNARESCPTLPGVKLVLHWPLEDPAEAIGSDAQKMEVFRRVRDEIHARISDYLKTCDA